jgi:hypothetical protein
MFLSPLRRGFASSRTRCSLAGVLPLSCFLAAFALGCDDSEDSPALTGELRSNEFFYDCVTPDDVQCRRDLTAFPDAIAVGGEFELRANRNLASSLFIKPASPQFVSSVGSEFEFLRQGVTAFLALDNDDEIQDFVHLRALPVDEIQVEGSFGERVSSVTMTAGRDVTLVAVPLANDEELAGSLSFRWLIENEDLVRIPRRGTEVRLEAVEPGTTRLRVELDEVSTTIEVTITPAERDPVDANVGPSNDAGDANVADAGDDLDGGFDAASEGLPSNTLDAAPSSSDSDATASETTPMDAAPPKDADVASDAETLAEAGDQ